MHKFQYNRESIAFNGSTGVIVCSDSEYDNVNNMW